ncbi:MAG: hypothetical protein A3C56_06670 [Ignavibacteria bacterium RIFCSPHIGHO2_02_FULL_56_12]|nr:MAG: hypothetical protein A3C56_06670 [Ignavibacteria bacterium RIFCSPHIGHO2_02_FULL_56_12]
MHGLSVRAYDSDFAKSFLPSEPWSVVLAGESSRVTIKPGDGVLEERKNDRTSDYAISFAVGGKNVLYFLTELDRGRIQTLPIAYDVRASSWFHTAGANLRHFGQGSGDAPLPWRDRAYTFNNSCYRCHVSQARTSYDPAIDVYSLTWSEPGINCETCHGPAADHIRAFSSRMDSGAHPDLHLISAKRFAPAQSNDLCSPCHAKMLPLTAAYTPGERFFDHFDLVTWEDPDFAADGRDLGENYTMTSWLTSPCRRAKTLTCMHCHTSSGRFRFVNEPDKACLPCHAERVRDAASHSRHAAGTKGAQCFSCHMPKSEFARMSRSDHSMRPPTPGVTKKFGSPNACTQCHNEKSASWADSVVRKWHPNDFQRPVLEMSARLEEAKKGVWTRFEDMKRSIGKNGREEVYAASLLRAMRNWPDKQKVEAADIGLKDQSPLVRAAAAQALYGSTGPRVESLLQSAAGDSIRLVRVRAAESYASVAVNVRQQKASDRMIDALNEYVAFLMARPDDHASLYNLGNYYASTGDQKNAISAYERALKLRPEFVSARVNASFAYEAAGRNSEAEQQLRMALSADPWNVAANLNLGLLLAGRGEATDAETRLRAAYTGDTTLAVAAYNLAVLTARYDRNESVRWSMRAVALRPLEPKYVFARAFYLHEAGKEEEAIGVLRAALRDKTSSTDIYGLLGELLESRSSFAEARKVYLQGANDVTIPASERDMLASKAAR